MARGRTERAESKAKTAGTLAGLGASIGAVGGPVGAAVGGGIGAITGLIIGDDTTVFPIDMIAIPAYQAYLLSGTPSFAIYIKEGEVLTQVQPTDAETGLSQLTADVVSTVVAGAASKKKRPLTAYQKRYKAAFKKVRTKFTKKDGTWSKGGFKKAVRAAHKIAGGRK